MTSEGSVVTAAKNPMSPPKAATTNAPASTKALANNDSGGPNSRSERSNAIQAPSAPPPTDAMSESAPTTIEEANRRFPIRRTSTRIDGGPSAGFASIENSVAHDRSRARTSC